MLERYDPRDWFWIIGGDETRAYWSKTRSFVTEWPEGRVTRIASAAELRDVLAEQGLLIKQINKKQFVLRCVALGFMTGTQAKNLMKTSDLPTAVTTYIATLPADQQDAALIDMYDGRYSRDNPVVVWFLTGRDLSADGIDDFFRDAAAH